MHILGGILSFTVLHGWVICCYNFTSKGVQAFGRVWNKVPNQAIIILNLPNTTGQRHEHWSFLDIIFCAKDSAYTLLQRRKSCYNGPIELSRVDLLQEYTYSADMSWQLLLLILYVEFYHLHFTFMSTNYLIVGFEGACAKSFG